MSRVQDIRLDLAAERSNNFATVTAPPKYFVAFVLAAFFAFGIVCATMAAPGQALASASGCSQAARPMVMVGCENPNYLCGFDPASDLLSHGALTSARSNDTVKNMLGLAVGAPAIDVPHDLTPRRAIELRNVPFPQPGKVPLYLFNSILTL